MSRWPFIKTRPDVADRIGWRHHAAACLAVLIVPTLSGFAGFHLFSTSGPLGETVWFPVDSFKISMLSIFVAFSFYFSWIGLLFGVPATVYALRKGFAGWGAVLLAGLAIGALIASLLSMPAALPMGPLLAMIYWLTLRLMAPDAFST